MAEQLDGVLKWVGNILFFLVLITVAENLLPGKSYNRYIRLSAGMVLILLVLKPVTAGFHLEEQIKRYFESFAFQQDAKDLSREILGIEEQRLTQVIDSYEQSVEADVNSMAEELGFRPVETRAVIERNRESGDYGTVIRIEMEVKRGEAENGEEEVNGNYAVQAVNPVDPVKVLVTEEKEGKTEDQEEGDEPSQEGALDQLRRKVEGYYGLEAGKVEIKFQKR